MQVKRQYKEKEDKELTHAVTFKDKPVYLDFDPRIGVCSRCRYVVGEVHKLTGKTYDRTHLHHEAYDKDNALAHTIELCVPCHRKADFEGYVKPHFKTVRLEDDTHEMLMRSKRYDVTNKKTESVDDVIRRLLKETK